MSSRYLTFVVTVISNRGRCCFSYILNILILLHTYPANRGDNIKELAFEGIDNVGKTSVATKLAELLRLEGNKVHISAPFHETTVSGAELYELFNSDETGAVTAIELLQDALHSAQQSATDNKCDYLLYDRHWMTTKIMLPTTELVPANDRPRTILLVSGNRDMHEMTDDEPWSTVEELTRYQEAYKRLAASNFCSMLGVYVVQDPATDIPKVAETIMWDERIVR